MFEEHKNNFFASLVYWSTGEEPDHWCANYLGSDMTVPYVNTEMEFINETNFIY